MLTDMKRILYLTAFIIAFTCVHAETIVLRTGARMVGTIVMQNEDVVIFRNAEGARFQYPRADVQEILKEDVPDVSEKAEETAE